MYSQKDVPFNRFSLRFSDENLETAFRNDYFDKNLAHFRLFIALGTVFYALYGIHDYWILPDIVHEAWVIRYLIVCPLLVALFCFTYAQQFRNYMEPALFLACLAAGAGIIAMITTAAPPGSYMCYTGLLLCLLFFFRLRFATATILSWCLFALYETAAVFDPGTPPRVLFSNTFILLSFIIAGMFMCYALERYMRSDFLLRKIIQERTEQIGAANRALELEMEEHRQTDKEKHRLEARLFQNQKLEAVGQLAAGVSHEFNNILTAIVGYANYLNVKMDPNDHLYPYPGKIIAAGQRASRLTKELLAFGLKQQIEPKATDLNAILLKAKTFLNLTLNKTITLSVSVSDTPLVVMADDVLMEQVLVNLAANARDAMPEGGTLTLITDMADMKHEFSHAHGSAPPGRYGRISITDSGTGMDNTIRSRIFEPFFTTKELGKGTGLGLSMAYGIIRQHQGYIDIVSEPGAGATFTIFLPLLATEDI